MFLELLHRYVVACDQDHRNTKPSRQHGVHAALAHRSSVDLEILHVRVAGVREESAVAAGLGVVADEKHRVEGGIEPLHHPVSLERIGDEPRARRQILDTKVRMGPVRVVDHNLARTSGERSANGGIGVVGHQYPAAETIVSLATPLMPSRSTEM